MNMRKMTRAVPLATALLFGATTTVLAETWTVQTSMPAGSAIFKHVEAWGEKLKIITSYIIKKKGLYPTVIFTKKYFN